MPVHIGSFRKSIGGLTVAIWFVLQVVGSVFLLLCGTFALAQQTIATNTNAAVPPLVNFSGTLTESNGKPLTGTVAVTFSLYSEPSGGGALWMESQNVQADQNGHYTVTLGSTSSTGLPADIFVSGQAHWLGVRVQGEEEQPRVLLVSAPYAMKAGDAATIGGLPPSAFVLAVPATSANPGTATAENASPEGATGSPLTSSDVTTTGGTANTIPVFTTSTNIQNSIVTQTGTTAISVAGKLNLPATGTATSSAGKNSQAQTFAASAYNSGTSAAVAETFQLQAEPSGNDTSSPSGTLNVLFGSGTSTPTETGLKISNKGLLTFATGQTFPGTGTITGITTASGSGLSGGGTTGTLSLKIPSAGVTNAMLADSKITLNANSAGGLTTPGAMTLGTTYTIGLKPCSANQILQYSGSVWNCASAGSGTVTSVGSGAGLTGGPITGSGTLSIASGGVTNAMLQNPSLTVKAGTSLTGGGAVSLGGSTTLNLDTTKVPLLNAANSFTGNQSVTGNFSATGSISGQTGSFSANNSTQVVNVTQSGTGSAVIAAIPTSSIGYTPAIEGEATGSGSSGVGVEGLSGATNGFGVYGWTTNTNAGTAGIGVYGQTDTSVGVGVAGVADSTASGSTAAGIFGESTASDGVGVIGFDGNEGTGIGVLGYTEAASGIGMYGWWETPSASGAGLAAIGVWGDSSDGIGVVGSSDFSAGVYGISGANSGLAGGAGVWGTSMSSGGIGVGGQANNGTGGSFEGYYGSFSWTDGLIGSYGQFANPSNSGSGISNTGVWGDSGNSGTLGVVGTTDDGNSIFGINDTVNHETLYVQNNSGFVSGQAPLAARFAGPGASTYCYIPRDTADNGTGDIVCTGTKSAAVPVDGNRMVRLYAVEAADNWFEDAGSGQLANGSAAVALDGVFAQTVNGGLEYHVFITPNGECEGLYVSNKTAKGFEVHELHGGHSNIAFDFRIMVRRKGFENVRMQDVTEDFARMKQEEDLFEARREAAKVEQKNHPLPAQGGDALKKGTWKASSAGRAMPRLPIGVRQPVRK